MHGWLWGCRHRALQIGSRLGWKNASVSTFLGKSCDSSDSAALSSEVSTANEGVKVAGDKTGLVTSEYPAKAVKGEGCTCICG